MTPDVRCPSQSADLGLLVAETRLSAATCHLRHLRRCAPADDSDHADQG